MARMSGLQSLVRQVSRKWSGLKRKLFYPRDLHPGQVTELLEHARQSGPSQLLHLIHLIEELQGHRGSANKQQSIDAAGAPLPWFTYPAIAYLGQIDLRDKMVFEFGAGHSSLYFARRAKQVLTVDNDSSWQARIVSQAPPNLHVLLRTTEKAYVQTLAETGQTWDIIVIDGRWRRRCADAAVQALSQTGMIVLDNADWYPNTAQTLRTADLLQVDFTGLGPVNYYQWTTSFFLRRGTQFNRLNHQHVIGGLDEKRTDDS
ncbi:MAG: hypothetical protein L0215_09115 [Gemmataceae bacterium]|nr:hypothetical protein [Gemmataceae bacterium]